MPTEPSTRFTAPPGSAATSTGLGYWLVAANGGVFSVRGAGFLGSTAALELRAPVVGMATTPDGNGYWLVAADGGVFTYGDATFFGGTGLFTLNQAIVGMAPTPDGQGYWLVGADGAVRPSATPASSAPWASSI